VEYLLQPVDEGLLLNTIQRVLMPPLAAFEMGMQMVQHM
jgi:hypothetical protein